MHLAEVQIYGDILILLPTASGKAAKDLDLPGILMLLLTADGKVFSLYHSHVFCLVCTECEVRLPVLGDPKHPHMHVT